MKLATFNVKDLFDPGFGAKLDELARHVRRARADVLALNEVGSEEALDGLVARVAEDVDYKHRIVGKPDKRGIRNVILSRHPLAASREHHRSSLPFPALHDGDPPPFGDRIPLRRAIPEVRVKAPFGEVAIFAAHFKSKRGVGPKDAGGAERDPVTPAERAAADVRSLVLRAAEALFVRELVDAALATTPFVAVLGDLNDVPDSVPLRVLCRCGEGALVSAAEVVPHDARVSALHGGHRSQIDHVLLSPALRARVTDAGFFNEELRDHGPVPADDAPPTVDSDHALFWATVADEA